MFVFYYINVIWRSIHQIILSTEYIHLMIMVSWSDILYHDEWYMCDLIHETWYCKTDKVTYIMHVIFIIYLFWFCKLFWPFIQKNCGNVCLYVSFLDVTSSCFPSLVPFLKFAERNGTIKQRYCIPINAVCVLVLIQKARSIYWGFLISYHYPLKQD